MKERECWGGTGFISEMTTLVNTPYDDVFRTLLNDCPFFIIPVVNELFGESYTGQETVELCPNEHFINAQDGREQERITDSCFLVRGETVRKFHIECQSTADDSMLIRMFEYECQIALDAGEIRDNVLTVRFPSSAVLYLRSKASTPDVMTIRIELPDGGLAEYEIPVMKAQRYSPDEIFSRGLLFLIPFRIFAHERRFGEYERDEKLLQGLVGEYEGIKKRLEVLSESGILTEYAKRTLEEMSGKVLEHIARRYDKVREGVKSVMGGKVLEYEAKTILNQGIALGEARGRTEGHADVARNLLRMGVEPPRISEATGLSLEQIEALKLSQA